jgi:hypothetical protein
MNSRGMIKCKSQEATKNARSVAADILVGISLNWKMSDWQKAHKSIIVSVTSRPVDTSNTFEGGYLQIARILP